MASRLWVDKYRPASLEELDYHHQLKELLIRLSTADDIPHLLFYGPSGAGKKTRVLTLLTNIFGAGVSKVKCETKIFKAGSSNVEIKVLQSNYHIDMTPSDVFNRDRIVVQQIIKEIGSSKNPDNRLFKVVVINQADHLTQEAQAALRRTLEKSTVSTRLILICNSLCRVIMPLRSRCLAIRVPAPDESTISTILQEIANRENVHLPAGLSNRIVEASKRNLRRAIMMFQTCYLSQVRLADDTQIVLPDWERHLREVVMNVLEEQSPTRLKIVRSKLYEVLASCIPPTTIMNTLTKEMLSKVDDELKYEISRHAAMYELQMQQGQKAIVHLEAFLARSMSMFKQHLNKLVAMM